MMNVLYEAPTVGLGAGSTTAGVYEKAGRLSLIVVAGSMFLPGTSTAARTVYAEARHVNATISSPSAAPPANLNGDECAVTSEKAVNELRLISGLTWDQIALLFGVSRRSIHFWANGKPLNRSNEERLMRVLDIVRRSDRGSSRENRSALLNVVDGLSAFDLLARGDSDAAASILGVGAPRESRQLRPLNRASSSARKPHELEILLGSKEDLISPSGDRSRAARAARMRRPENGNES